MSGFRIVQRANHNAVYATGFYSRERAEQWLDNYNPQHWIDKNIQRNDLEIIPEPAYVRRRTGRSRRRV